jgi:hypothetical protein
MPARLHLRLTILLASSLVAISLVAATAIAKPARFLSAAEATREAARVGRQRLADRQVHASGNPTVTLRKFSAQKGGAFVNVAFPVKARPGQPGKVVLKGWIDMRLGTEAPASRVDLK